MSIYTKKGFTLIELLLVIAIIAILAAVVFVALDPLRRFQDSRDSSRWQDVAAVVSAIKVDQVDNGGDYLSDIDSLSYGSVYMIVDGNTTSGCDDQNAYCDENVSGDSYCVDLSGLVDQGYLSDVPVSPDGDGTWTSDISGYTLTASSTGQVTVRACESENSTDIYITR